MIEGVWILIMATLLSIGLGLILYMVMGDD